MILMIGCASATRTGRLRYSECVVVRVMIITVATLSATRVIQVQQTSCFFAVTAGGGVTDSRRPVDAEIDADDRRVGGVEVGLEEANRTRLLGGLHRTGLRHLDRGRATQISCRAPARSTTTNPQCCPRCWCRCATTARTTSTLMMTWW